MADTVRPRYGGSKTRTGCITCKARHVKCDEAKPHCNRCIKAGRRCEGYASPPKPRSSDQLTIINYVAPNSRSVSPYPQVDSREVRALQYFKTCTGPELAGAFSSDLWTTFMLRLAHHQSSVHHALVALGTVHEEFANSGIGGADFSDYATREYSKAIHEVVELNVSASSEAVEIALTTCVLFACIEGLRGHYQSSLSHLMSGLNVLEEEQRQQKSQQNKCIPRELLLSLFMRMDSQRMDLGGAGTIPGMMLSLMVRPTIPPCFSSLEDARLQLDTLYHHVLQLMYRAEEASIDKEGSHPPDFWQGLLSQKQALEDIRQSWENAFNAMLSQNSTGGSPQSSNRSPGVIVLDMNDAALKIILAVDMLQPELDFDKYNHLFQTIVNDAEEYIQRTSEMRPALHIRPSSSSSTPSIHSSPEPLTAGATSRNPSQSPPKPLLLPRPEPIPIPKFSLSLGCVACLYLSAARCRAPHIRYRALSLLQKCNRREGLWDSNVAGLIAGRVIAIEEAKTMEALNININANNLPHLQRHSKGKDKEPASTNPNSPSPPPKATDGFVIPFESRVKTIDLKFGPDAKGKAMYSMEYPTRALGTTTGTMPSAMDTGAGSGFGELFEW